MPVEGDKDEGNKQKTLDYVRKMDLDVTNIDKNDKYKRRTIYEAIDVPYFGEAKIFTKAFTIHCRKHKNDP